MLFTYEQLASFMLPRMNFEKNGVPVCNRNQRRNFPFSIVGDSQFNDANTSLSNFLKTLSKSGQLAPTVHKQPLTKEIVAKLYGEGEPWKEGP